MNKITVFISTLALLLTIVAAYEISEQEYQLAFTRWMSQFSKTYSNQEFPIRYSAFKSNYLRIYTFNNDQEKGRRTTGGATYKLGLNQYSDMTYAEFVRTIAPPLPANNIEPEPVDSSEYASYSEDSSSSTPSNGHGHGHEHSDSDSDSDDEDQDQPQQPPPAQFQPPTRTTLAGKPRRLPKIPVKADWSNRAQIKNQQSCGSCYAFSAASVIESFIMISKGASSTTPLAPQQIVSCSSSLGNCKCNGGWPSLSFEYIKRAGGIADETVVPYTNSNGTCPMKMSAVASITGWVKITAANDPAATEKQFKEVVYKNPIASVMHVSENILSYSSGIYNDDSCPKDPSSLNHAIVIVGYGRDMSQKLDYWIVQNSWGTSWGEKGYFRITRGKNTCGIGYVGYYPTGVVSYG